VIGQPVSLELQRVSKTFGGTAALRDVSLTVEPGTIHALVGHNGSGKSTLVKVLSGFHRPDPGSVVRIDGDVRFVHQDLGVIEEMSVMENLSLGLHHRRGLTRVRRATERRDAARALERVGCRAHLDRRVGSLPAAERTSVAMARALRDSEVAYLVLDEPTATLPSDEVPRLFAVIRGLAAQGTGVLYISHHLHEVFEVADVTTVLRDGAVVHTGPASAVDRDELVRLIVGRDVETVSRAGAGAGDDASAPVLSVEDLHGGDVRGVSFHVRPGEIVGLTGGSGSGHDSVLAMVFGTLSRSGRVRVDVADVPANRPHRSIASGMLFVPSDRHGQAILPALTIGENMLVHPGRRALSRLRHRREAAEIETWIRQFAVRPSRVGASIDQASGGNQQKVVLARALRLRPRVLLLHEPTQGVDIGARSEIHRAIRRAVDDGSGVLLASSDEQELIHMCDRVLVMGGGTVRTELRGTQLDADHLVSAALQAGGSHHE
jgi:ribose transport system ATP-binding protein